MNPEIESEKEKRAEGAEPSVQVVNDAPVAAAAVAAPTIAKGWRVVTVKPRVDSFNQDALINEIKEAGASGAKMIALDLHANRFLSFPVLKFCVDFAKKLADDGGYFALVGCTQKTKKHFEIYGSLKNIRVARALSELPAKPPAREN